MEKKKKSSFSMYIDSLKSDLDLEKETMSKMETKREKIGYFLYYHKWHLLIALVCLVTIVYLVFTLAISKKSIYYCLVINDSYNKVFPAELDKEFSEVIDYDQKREKINVALYSTDVTNYEPGYYGGDSGMQGIFSLMMDNLIDSMIAEEKELAWFAKDDNLCNLKEVLPSDLYENLEDKMIYLENSSGDAVAAAIDISDTTLYKEGKSNLKSPGIAIFVTTTHLEDDINAIKYIFDYKDN
ncbi:MAG: hypothetical protein K5656_06530 [Lachnospiraceae bacterium]|nr:hypothetical protein [Lachnospiraceae bacterium]